MRKRVEVTILAPGLFLHFFTDTFIDYYCLAVIQRAYIIRVYPHCALSILIVVSSIFSGSIAIAFCPEIIMMELINFPNKPIYFLQLFLWQIQDSCSVLMFLRIRCQALTVAMSQSRASPECLFCYDVLCWRLDWKLGCFQVGFCFLLLLPVGKH